MWIDPVVDETPSGIGRILWLQGYLCGKVDIMLHPGRPL